MKPAIALFLAALASQSHAQFDGLNQLTEHCWQATFPDGIKTDTHCFDWVYDKAFVRDEHVVCGGEKPYGGVTWYSQNQASGAVSYRYYNSLGGVSDGSVSFEKGVLRFPDETYEQGEKRVVYRTTWTLGDGQYTSNMSQLMAEDEWKPIWEMTFKKATGVADAAAARNAAGQLHCH